jgi:hypothetical protein
VQKTIFRTSAKSDSNIYSGTWGEKCVFKWLRNYQVDQQIAKNLGISTAH